jgi:hypothetical protein
MGGQYYDGSSGIVLCGCGLDRAVSGEGQVRGTCECGNEPFVSIK